MAAPILSSTSKAASASVTFSGVAVGNLLWAIVTHDRAATLSVNNGFTVVAQLASGSGTVAVHSALIAKIATSTTETVTVSGGTRTMSNMAGIITGHTLASIAAWSTINANNTSGTSINANAVTGLDSSTEYLSLMVLSTGDGNIVMSSGAKPAGYTYVDGISSGAGSTNVCTSLAQANVTGVTSEDPPTFTLSGAGNYVAWTLLIPSVNSSNFTGSADLSGSGTLSASGSPSPVQTGALTGSGTLSGSGSPKPIQTANLSGSGTLSAVGTPGRAVGLTGSGTLSAVGVPGFSRTVNLSGSGTLSGVGAIGATPALSGSGTLSAFGVPAISVTAALTGSGTLTSPTRTPGFSRTAALSGGGTLDDTVVVGFPKTVPLDGTGTLMAVATFGMVVNLGGSGQLTIPNRIVGFSRVGALDGSGTLSAPTRTPSLNRTGALTGSGTLSAFGSAFIPVPVTPSAKTGIELEIYHYSDWTTARGILPLRTAPTALNEMKGVGGGSFTISRSDPKLLADPTLVKGRNICKIKVDTEYVGAFLMGDRESTIIGSGERAEIAYKLAGPGLKQLFDDADIYPWGGIKPQSRSKRNFNFASEPGDWYNPANWVDPTLFSTVGSQAHYPLPAKWPSKAPNAGWIWGSPFLNPGPMPFGICYFRYTLNITNAGRYAIYTAVDDVFTLYVDGEQIAKSAENSTSWKEASRVEVDLSVGTHIIGYAARNLQAVGYNGPAALACAVFRIMGLEEETLVGGSQVSGWKVNAYPTRAPGWSPGEVILDLLAEAEARGIIFPTILNPTFTATVDSNGVPWPSDLYTDWSFGVGDSMLSVITKMEEASVDIWIDPENYDLNMVPSRGKDRTIFTFAGPTATSTPIEFKLGKHLRVANTQSKSKIKNSLLLKTLEGWIEDTDSSSISQYGRIEATLNTDASPQLAQVLADLVFTQRAQEEEGASYELIVGEYIPFVDFNIGDWVLAPNEQGVATKRRVMSISVTEGSAGETLYAIEFDTIFKDNESRLNGIVDKLGGGGVGGGLANVPGSTPGVGEPIVIPPPATPQYRVPKAPTGLAATSAGQWTPDGITPYSVVTLTWNPVTQATDNSAMTPEYYEIQGWINGTTNYQDFGRVTTNTVNLQPFTPTDNWVFQVRAVGPDSINSDWSTVATAVMNAPVGNLLAPDPPSVSSSRGTMTISWSGLLGAITPPPEFRYVYAEVSADSSTGPWQRVGPALERLGRNIGVPNITVGQQYWVQLLAVDGAGNISPASLPVSHTVKGIVGPDIEANSVNANVIIAGSIKTNHISPEVGSQLTLDGNVTIVAVEDSVANAQASADSTQDNLDVMQQYYSFGPTGAVVSKPGSVFATRIDNDSIDMLENGNVISYWNSGTLYVNQMVGSKVTLGNHQLEQYGPDDTIVRAL